MLSGGSTKGYFSFANSSFEPLASFRVMWSPDCSI
jgi:hypothetical protein